MVTQSDFKRYYSTKFDLNDGQVKQLFRLFDFDHDGSIDFLE